ncbi:hypothetical protein ABZU32_11745 [Sphaerisporangium sp. NPDC005288]|uniref:hypothetical protein n=1 Tax=Sphaerisporangium sp. NPDC005288 TaxID=3155114 RepID=UPI0033AF0D9F
MEVIAFHVMLLPEPTNSNGQVVKNRTLLMLWPAVAAAVLVTGLTEPAVAALQPKIELASGLGVSAAKCDWYPDGGIDDLTGPAYVKAGTWLRGGPYASCDGYKTTSVKWANTHCRYVNSAGNLWYYTIEGWVYSANVTFPYGNVPTKAC